MAQHLFTIGKIIQVRADQNTVHKLAFIETDEHLRHAHQLVQWLYPSASLELKRAAKEHDIGKKIYLRSEFVRSGGRRDLRLTQENLRQDFYGEYEGKKFTVSEAIDRYLSFIEDPGHVKTSVVRHNPEDDGSSIERIRYKLDPPFGNHAASVELRDLRDNAGGDVNYIHILIQLHHNFQVDKLVAAAAQYGEQIIADLYRLITADHEASRWAEYVVQKLEDGEDSPQIKFGFSEFAVECVVEPEKISRNDARVQGQVTLQATLRPDLGETKLTVDYYVTDYALTPAKFLAAKQQRGARK
jgi:hypothetical protein